MKVYKSNMQVKGYCESCQGEYMSSPGEGCPVCSVKQAPAEKTKAKREVKKSE